MLKDRLKIFEDLSALADGEIKDYQTEIKLREKIEYDKEFRVEYNIQKSVKSLIKKRLKKESTPDYLKERIRSNLIPTKQPAKRRFILSESLSGFFKKPAAFFAFALSVIIIMLVFPFSSGVDINGSDMFTQAETNFNKILSGELAPQKICNSSEEVIEFFNHAGVQYSTIVPEFTEWSILGAVVSNENGEKLAHHVYTDNQGHLIYIYQVNEDQLTEKKLFELSPYLLNKCKTKRFIKFNSTNFSTYVFLYNHNIFALVTNEDDSKIENKFIAGLIND